MSILPGNPYQTTAKTGTFSAYSDGVFQGMADADPAVQNYLNMGQLDTAASNPVWGGVPLSESVFAGLQSANRPKVDAATAVGNVTGFAVFDQGHHGVITPGPNNVPLFYPGMDVPFYRMGSRARIAVQASSALVALVGSTINPSVSWNFTTQELVPTSAGTSYTVTGVAVTGSSNPYVATFTTSAAHGYNVGDTVTTSGFTPTGYNGTFEVIAVPSSTTFSVLLTTNPGAVTVEGSVAITAGTGTLAVSVLSVHTNSRIVYNDPQSGNIYWKNGYAAIILI